MRRLRSYLGVAGFAGMLLIPQPARAEILWVGWLGANAAGRSGPGPIDLGASVGTTVAGVIGADFDFGYSPELLGNADSYVVTAMGNVTIGIPFDGTRAAGIRPYLTSGLGLIRSRVASQPYGYSASNNDLGVNVAGGLMVFAGRHAGVRADIRYIRSLEDDTRSSYFSTTVAHLSYWRASVGLVLR
jgi:hypothetical protein